LACLYPTDSLVELVATALQALLPSGSNIYIANNVTSNAAKDGAWIQADHGIAAFLSMARLTAQDIPPNHPP